MFEMVCLANRLSIQSFEMLYEQKKQESSDKLPFSAQAFQGQALCQDV